jgi:hypothetical protein
MFILSLCQRIRRQYQQQQQIISVEVWKQQQKISHPEACKNCETITSSAIIKYCSDFRVYTKKKDLADLSKEWPCSKLAPIWWYSGAALLPFGPENCPTNGRPPPFLSLHFDGRFLLERLHLLLFFSL